MCRSQKSRFRNLEVIVDILREKYTRRPKKCQKWHNAVERFPHISMTSTNLHTYEVSEEPSLSLVYEYADNSILTMSVVLRISIQPVINNP